MITSSKSQQIALPTPSAKAALLRQARQVHLYLGVFFAPAILFFSMTGALQLFGLHEGHPGEAYQPPKWISTLASIHKDQVLSKQHGPPALGGNQHGAASPSISDVNRRPGGPAGQRRGEERHEGKATLFLKWYFFGMSIGLITTTLLGIYMAFKYNRSRVTVWGLLIAGFAIPMTLIALLA